MSPSPAQPSVFLTHKKEIREQFVRRVESDNQNEKQKWTKPSDMRHGESRMMKRVLNKEQQAKLLLLYGCGAALVR